MGVLAAQHLGRDPRRVGVVARGGVAERLARHAEIPDHRAEPWIEEDGVGRGLAGRLALADRVVERVGDAQQQRQRARGRELGDAPVLRQGHGRADVVRHVEPAVEVAGRDERQQPVAGQLGALGGRGREPDPAVVLGGSPGHAEAHRLVLEVDDRVVTVAGARQSLDRLGDEGLVGSRAVCGWARLVHRRHPESEKTWGRGGGRLLRSGGARRGLRDHRRRRRVEGRRGRGRGLLGTFWPASASACAPGPAGPAPRRAWTGRRCRRPRRAARRAIRAGRCPGWPARCC